MSLPSLQPFRDRHDAGCCLARQLAHHAYRPDAVVLALPRGGVPVGFEVARSLRVPLDVFVVRKLGVPGQEELAFGAIASGGHHVLNSRLVGQLGLGPHDVTSIAAREERELRRREQLYRGSRPPLELNDRAVILIDDGLATGSTMCVAARAVRAERPSHLVIAVPVAAPSTIEWIRDEADEVAVCQVPREFIAVGEWYLDFEQTRDEEVIDLLRRSTESRWSA